MIGVNPDYDYLFDPQQARPAGFCHICGREIYGEGRELCDECEEVEYRDV